MNSLNIPLDIVPDPPKESKPWTIEERLHLWKAILFFEGELDRGTLPISFRQKIAQELNRTDNSVRSEIWKMFRASTQKETPKVYWDRANRSEIKLGVARHNDPLTKTEHTLIYLAFQSGMPASRLAPLLGRSKKWVQDYFSQIHSRGRRNSFGIQPDEENNGIAPQAKKPGD